MKAMKSLARIEALALCAHSEQARCVAHVGRSSGDPMALVATPSALIIDVEDGQPLAPARFRSRTLNLETMSASVVGQVLTVASGCFGAGCPT